MKLTIVHKYLQNKTFQFMKYCLTIINTSLYFVKLLYKSHENDINSKRITNIIVYDIKSINAKRQVLIYMHSAIRGCRTHGIYYRQSDDFKSRDRR